LIPGSRRRKVQVVHHDSCSVFCTPYKEEFVRELKASVPPRARGWNSFLKVWIVDSAFVGAALRLAQKHFSKVEEVRLSDDEMPEMAFFDSRGEIEAFLIKGRTVSWEDLVGRPSVHPRLEREISEILEREGFL